MINLNQKSFIILQYFIHFCALETESISKMNGIESIVKQHDLRIYECNSISKRSTQNLTLITPLHYKSDTFRIHLRHLGFHWDQNASDSNHGRIFKDILIQWHVVQLLLSDEIDHESYCWWKYSLRVHQLINQNGHRPIISQIMSKRNFKFQ